MLNLAAYLVGLRRRVCLFLLFLFIEIWDEYSEMCVLPRNILPGIAPANHPVYILNLLFGEPDVVEKISGPLGGSWYYYVNGNDRFGLAISEEGIVGNVMKHQGDKVTMK